jgi:hypothetical protein
MKANLLSFSEAVSEPIVRAVQQGGYSALFNRLLLSEQSRSQAPSLTERSGQVINIVLFHIIIANVIRSEPQYIKQLHTVGKGPRSPINFFCSEQSQNQG